MSWFDTSSSAVEGIQYYEHNIDVSISDYIAMYDETPEILCDPSDTPRVVVMYAGECGFPNNSTQVVKELVDSAYKGYHVAFFTEQWSESSYRHDLLLNNNESMIWFDGSGNISCCCTDASRCDWTVDVLPSNRKSTDFMQRSFHR